MKKLLAAAAIVAFVSVAAPARAADDTGVSLALRAGVGIPMGDAVSGGKLSDAVSTLIPLQVDVGYRFTKNILAGAYFQYGIGSVASALSARLPGASIHNLRFGIEGIYNFMPDNQFMPWAGIGFGYEIASGSGSAANSDFSFKGLEFVNLQLGGDYKVSPMFSVGPFASFHVASYSSASIGGQDVQNLQTGTHEWLQFGLKGTFNL